MTSLAMSLDQGYNTRNKTPAPIECASNVTEFSSSETYPFKFAAHFWLGSLFSRFYFEYYSVGWIFTWLSVAFAV